MKRLNARHLAALTVWAGLSAPAAFAASPWGPSGEASYEEHQAPVVSLYSRAEVQEAYRQAAVAGWLPRTGDVVAESPAELAIAHAPLEVQPVAVSPAEQPLEPVASADPWSTPLAGSYASPADAEMLVSMQSSRLSDAGWPSPDAPQAPLSANTDMMSKSNDELALSEGEELVASDSTAPALPIH